MAKDREKLTRQGDRLRSLREQFGERIGRKYTQRDAANLLKVKEDSYRTYEYGRAELPEERARILASEWEIPWQAIYDVQGRELTAYSEGSDVSGPLIPLPRLNVPIPYVGNVGANHKVDWLDPVESDDFIDVPTEMATPIGPSARFACTVVGDSCYDLLWPGDTAVFHKCDIPKINQMILFRSFDDRVTIKQMKHDGRGFILHPLNPAYEDQEARGVVVGYLVGIVRLQGSRRVTVYDAHGISP